MLPLPKGTIMRSTRFASALTCLLLTLSAAPVALAQDSIDAPGFDESGMPLDGVFSDQSMGRTLFSSNREPQASPEVLRRKMAQWGDPLTPPQTRTRCVKSATGRIFGKRWRTCVGWATDVKFLQRELFMIVRGPDPAALADEAESKVREAIEACTITAVAAGGAAAMAAPSPEPLVRLGAGFEAAKVAWDACVTVKKAELAAFIADVPFNYSVDFDATSSWGKWSNE